MKRSVGSYIKRWRTTDVCHWARFDVKPTRLLLDESTLGMSPMMVREIGKIVTDLNSMGISIMLVEQNARLALRVSYLCFVLERGEILIKGYSKELTNNEYLKKAYLGEFSSGRHE